MAAGQNAIHSNRRGRQSTAKKAKTKAAPQRKRRATGDAPEPAQSQQDAPPIAGSYVFDGRTVHVREDGSLTFPDDEWMREEDGIAVGIEKPDRDAVLQLVADREIELLAIDYDPEYRDAALATLRAFGALVSGDAAETEGE